MEYSLAVSVTPVGNNKLPVVQVTVFRYVDSVIDAHTSLVFDRIAMPDLGDEEAILTWSVANLRNIEARLEEQLAEVASSPSGKLTLAWQTFKKSLSSASG